ncbi:hypothetical protein CP970_19025 [Streptomyces kanamyceticus]|uniref:Peptidase n=1 Tax=Streptomyces kanamyceticus TaxID=1967 RepID=A0A5J6GAA9_STRKN|nr:hypothetical protein [Streptomyces kanamyceticus]QEU92720.1 hypothetical protein CP970_19025 [Streptomyces kanamyceticus]
MAVLALAIPATAPTAVAAPAAGAHEPHPAAAAHDRHSAARTAAQAPEAPSEPSEDPSEPPEDPAQVWSRISVPHLSLPRSGEAVAVDPMIEFYDGAKSLPGPREVRLVIDTSGLRGVATVKVTDGLCAAEGPVITCGFEKYLRGPDKPISVTAVEGVAAGTSATIRYEVTGERLTGARTTSRVSLGTPRLEVAQLPDKEGLKTGQGIEVPVVLRNTGDRVTERIAVKAAGDSGIRLAQRHSNCRYRQGDYGDHIAAATCYFDRPLAPGERVALASPLPGSLTDDAFHTQVTYSAEAVPGDQDTTQGGTAGSGPELTLVPAPGQGTGFATERLVRFVAKNSADIRAIGDTLKPGKKGTTRELTFGLHNEGPALVARPLREPAVYVEVTLPKGVVASTVRVDEEPDENADGNCFTYEDGKRKPFAPGHRRYLCPDAGVEAPGSGQSYSFEVRYSEDVAAAEGTVRVRSGDTDRPGDGGFDLNDPDPANDEASIVVGKKAAGATGAARAADARPMAEAGAGVLPWIAAAAAALLGVGAVVFALVRRRAE